MLIVRATKKLLRLVGPPNLSEDHRCTTQLSQWYATVLFCRPRVALLVNESTLLPVLMPLAPAATWPARIGEQVATVLAAHDAPAAFVAEELRRMRDCRLGTTANCSVVGVMNEFARLAAIYRDTDPHLDRLELALRLAATPCGPLYGRNVSPDRELTATLRSLAG